MILGVIKHHASRVSKESIQLQVREKPINTGLNKYGAYFSHSV